MNTTTTPKVYCGTYGKYNNGSIAGAWLELADYADAAEFWKACKELHKDEDDAEYMFQDAEGLPEGTYSESGMDFDALIAYAQYTDEERELGDAYLSATGEKLENNDILEVAEECLAFTEDTSYSSMYKSFAEQVGYELLEGRQDIPDDLVNYIDYEQYGQDELDNCAEADGYAFRSY